MTYLLLIVVVAAYGTVLSQGLSRSGVGIALAIALATFAALRGPEVARDFAAYEAWYSSRALDTGFTERVGLFEEIYFQLNDLFARLNIPFRAFLWLIAFTAVCIKVRVILQSAANYVGAAAGLLTYIAGFYLLHEFTQIRVGAAIALLFIALGMLARGRTGAFVVLVVASSGFHTSGLAALLLLTPKAWHGSVWIERILLAVTLLLFLLVAAGLDPGAALATQAAVIDPRLDLYVALAAALDIGRGHVFGVSVVIVLALTVATLANGGYLRRNDKADGAAAQRRLLQLVCRAQLLGLIFLALFSSVPELSIRLYELMGAFLPLLAALVWSRRGIWLPKLLVLAWIASRVYTSVLMDEGLVEPYEWSLAAVCSFLPAAG